MAAPTASAAPYEHLFQKNTWSNQELMNILGVNKSELAEIRATAGQYLSRFPSINLKKQEEAKLHKERFADELRQRLGDKIDLAAISSAQTTDEYWAKWGQRAAIQLLRLDKKTSHNLVYERGVRAMAKAAPAGAATSVEPSVEQPVPLPDRSLSTPLNTSGSRRLLQLDPAPEAIRSQLPLSNYILELWDIRDLNGRMEFYYSFSLTDLYSDDQILLDQELTIKDLSHTKFIDYIQKLMPVDWEHNRLAYPYERDAKYNQEARTLRPVANPALAQMTWQAAIRTMCGLSPNRVAFVVFSRHDGFTESQPPAWQVNTIDKRDYDSFRQDVTESQIPVTGGSARSPGPTEQPMDVCYPEQQALRSTPSDVDEHARNILPLPEPQATPAQFGPAPSDIEDMQPAAPTGQVKNVRDDVVMSDVGSTFPNTSAPPLITSVDLLPSPPHSPTRSPAPSPQFHSGEGPAPPVPPISPKTGPAGEKVTGASRPGTPSEEGLAEAQGEDDVVQIDLTNADDKSSGDIFITIRQGDGQVAIPYTLEQAREVWKKTHPRMVFPEASEVIEPIKLSTVEGSRITLRGYTSTRVAKMSHNGIASAEDIPLLKQSIQDIATSDISLSHVITDSLDCSQMDEQLWQRCCTFFCFDPRVRRPEVMVSLPGLKVPLFVYQAYAVYWMLEQCTDFLRGFLFSDDTGLGKTVTTVALLVVRRSLLLATEEVTESRLRNDHRHLSIKEGKKPGAVCPSKGENKYSFPCPCISRDWYSRFELLYGPHLIVAPASIVANWYYELANKLLDFNNTWLNFSLVYAHGQRDIRNSLGAVPATKVTFLQTNSPPRDYNCLLLTPGKAVTAADIACSGRIVLTSFTSWETRLFTPTQHQAKQSNRSLEWASITVDEFHQHRHPTSALYRNLLRAPAKPFFHFLSATPFERSFADLREPLRCIQKHWTVAEIDEGKSATKVKLTGQWIAPRFQSVFFETAADSGKRLLKEQEAAEKDGPVNAERMRRMVAEAEFQHAILKQVMIRRLKGTTMFGRPLTKVPPHERCDIQVPMPSEYQAAYTTLVKRFRDLEIKTFQEHITSQTKNKKGPAKFDERRFIGSSSLLLRVCDVFPRLAGFIVDHINGPQPQKSQAEQLLHPTGELVQRMEQDLEGYDWLIKLIPELVESSARIRYFHKLMSKVRRNSRDWMGRQEKFLLFTSGPFITACLERYYSKHKRFEKQFLMLPSKVSDRQAVVNEFNGDVDLQDGTEKPDTSRFMIGTVGTLGTGFTLTRAARVILLQPDWMVSQERQCNGRVDRVAKVQHNQMTFSYRLRDDATEGRGSLVERSIIARQNRRSVLESLAYGDPAVAAQLRKLQEQGEAVRSRSECEEDGEYSDGDIA